MASGDLLALWNLSVIDSYLVEAKAHIAALDVGQVEFAQLKTLLPQEQAAVDKAKSLAAELVDAELKYKSHGEKVKQINASLFGGKIVNSREIEALQKEIEMIKRFQDELEPRIYELMDQVPVAKSEAEVLTAQVDSLKKAIGRKRAAAVKEKERLEAAIVDAEAKRKLAAQGIPVPLLTQYEKIRANQGGIGMAKITKQATCGMCGTKQPERTVDAARGDRLSTCENCHRILYYSDGMV